MKVISCELYCHSDSSHLQQIYTGYQMLGRKKIIKIIPKIRKKECYGNAKKPHLRDAKYTHLMVRINEKVAVYYDMHDSYEIDHDILDKVDAYFKRSFSRAALGNVGVGAKKVFPLGLNYAVRDSCLDMFALKRTFLNPGIEKVKAIIKATQFPWVFRDFLFYATRIDNSFSFPDFHLPPKVLFMSRTWNPSEARSTDKYKERDAINATRAQCIMLLKKELGKKYFFGGFARDAYSGAMYGDCLLPEGNYSKKKIYMNLLKGFPICISTKGLHNSIGWKFGEYVSHSKAILSEHLDFEVPGNFEDGKNYLAFNSPENCVEVCIKLLENKRVRDELMINNLRYYYSYLKPDILVFNSILTALQIT